MKAMLIDARQGLLDQRRREGIDKLDERWEGMWHLVNPPKRWHSRLNTDLLLTLGPIAKQRGLDAYGDGTGVFAASDDWRVPDQVYARPPHRTDDGVSSADLVIEVRSPDDETYEKLPFYAARGINEVLVLHKDRRVELYRLREDGAYVRVEDAAGRVHCATLDVAFEQVDGPALRLTWPTGEATL